VTYRSHINSHPEFTLPYPRATKDFSAYLNQRFKIPFKGKIYINM
jgi:hypothetical protein